VRSEGALGFRRGAKRSARIGEGEVKRIPLHLDFNTAVSAHRVAQKASVVLERPHVPVGTELLQ
jgi:hypothetical protein